MELYFLKSVACLAIFLLFYKLLLEKENMHVFKRFYLLTAMLAAVAIPFITFTTYIEPSHEIFQPIQLTPVEGAVETHFDLLKFLEIGLWVIYFLGVFFFSVKFFKNLYEIVLRIKRNPKLKESNFVNVLLTEKLNPHTFFNYIFLNKLKYEKHEIPKEVIIHEQAHAIQKHSLDILLVEFAQIVFWFNPLLFLLKDAIKLNHEFLADDSVLQTGTNPTGYKETLLSYSSGGLESGLVNSINYSSIKKRFTVMKTKTSKTAVWARSLLVLPLLAVLVFGFSKSEVVVKAQDQKQNIKSGETSDILISEDINVYIFRNGDITVNHQTVKLEGLEERLGKINRHLSIEKRKELTSANVKVEPGVKMGIITDVKMLLMKYGVKGIELSESATSSPDQETKTGLKEELEKLKDLRVNYNQQEKATPEMIKEFNAIVVDLNERAIIKQKDLNRITEIYALMTYDQKKKAVQPKFDISPFPSQETIREFGNYQQKATPEMVAEYNRLAAPHNSKPKGEAIIKKKDYERMKYIYGLMTPDQKKKAEAFPIPAPPPPLNEKMVAEYNKLAGSYNEREITEKVVQEKSFQRMLYIYGLMNESQRKTAEKLPPPPPPASAPKPVKGEGENLPAPPPPPVVEKAPPAPPTTILVDSISPPPPPSVTGVQPPPPPPPITFEELVKDGAVFYYNGKIIKPEEARKLVEVEKKVNIYISATNDEKPVVRLSDKKDK